MVRKILLKPVFNNIAKLVHVLPEKNVGKQWRAAWHQKPLRDLILTHDAAAESAEDRKWGEGAVCIHLCSSSVKTNDFKRDK